MFLEVLFDMVLFVFLCAPHDAAYNLLTHHWQVHEIIFPPYLAYIRRIIKSPRYTRGDFMFLYRFVRRRRRPQIFVHAITFEQLFGFLSILAQLLTLTYRLPD